MLISSQNIHRLNFIYEDIAPEIPSESSILAAKQKRERMRETKPSEEDGFISLSVTRRDAEYKGPHPESRLVREEDELGEGDDGAFGV